MANTTWVLEPSHSEVGFKVRHLMISNVAGHFTKFEATITSNSDSFDTAKVHFEADADSISTKNEQRDEHLKSAEFFDAAHHGKITFNSTGMEKKDDEHFTLTGALTIRGTTRQVELYVEFGGITLDPWGATRAGFELSGKINRKDFGLNWSAMTEAGGIVVSDEVKIHAAVEFVKQAAEEAVPA